MVITNFIKIENTFKKNWNIFAFQMHNYMHCSHTYIFQSTMIYIENIVLKFKIIGFFNHNMQKKL
jgi:ATP sulfurylase